jgi:hypothetical protein
MRIRNELQLHLVLGGSLAYLEQSIELQYTQFFLNHDVFLHCTRMCNRRLFMLIIHPLEKNSLRWCQRVRPSPSGRPNP